jgi:class 3 adenylate cyclase/tetratricopeptide (TPR) repeat protein
MDVACPGCAAPNPSTGRFCQECGTRLVGTCPSCSAAVTPTQKFCGECGTAITGAASIAPTVGGRDERESLTERRVCSVLFCDLVGFTPLSESRDAEEVRELLTRYFDTARTVIRRYGGIVEKFIGDAVMAVWGTPVAVEGDTERAVRAALDLVSAVAALGAEVNAPALAARAGVVTGSVAVAVGATNQGMVAGDAVNTAARVQSIAHAGSVFVDSATQRLAQAAVEFEDAGVHALKGKGEPQQLWRALRVLSGVGGAQRVDGLEAPLIGRDSELRLIKDVFHSSADRGQPRLMVVLGPAGVGKSRLGWEFEKYVDGLSDEVLWHRGRCLSYGEGVAFWALAEIVRQRLGIAEEDDVPVAAGKLATGLARYVPDAPEQDYIGVRLARLLGLPFAADTGQPLAREELFAGWRLWFELLTGDSPVVMLIEDVHSADDGLLAFLDHLMDWSRDVPIFVLAFARPELEERNPGWPIGRNRTTLALHPLDPQFMSSLLDALIPGMPSGAVSAIAEHAHGIPLFAVETVRALIDRDIVVPREGAYRLVGDIGQLTVPDSLHGLLAARLDALPPESRALLADAAVLGSTFPAEALVAVSGRDDAEVRAALADLVRREVLDILADKLSPQRGTYRFVHEMLRQVAYETLSRHDRKSRHLAVAAHLRATLANDGEEVVDVIARHYLDALAAVPDAMDVEQTRELAIDALIRAGERAARTGAQGRAAASFAHSAELCDAIEAGNPRRAAELWERAAWAALDHGDFDAVVPHADHARARYVGSDDRRAAARVQVIAAMALRRGAHFIDATERLDEALGVLKDNPDSDTVRAMEQRASVEIFSGGARGGRLAEEALRLAQSIGVGPAVLANAFTSRGIALVNENRSAEAAAYFREASRLAEQGNDRKAQGIALLNLSDALSSHSPSEAVEVAREGAVVLRMLGNRYLYSGALQNAVIALLSTSRWDEADTLLAQADDDEGLGRAYLESCQVWLLALRGDADGAASLLAGITAFDDSEDPQDQAGMLLLRAHVAYAAGDHPAALSTARAAYNYREVLSPHKDVVRWAWPLAVRAAYELRDTDATKELVGLLSDARRGEMAPMVHAERGLVLARLAVEDGDPRADSMFQSALAGLRTDSTPYHLAHGLLDYAEYLVRAGRADQAAAYADEAGGIAEQLGARPVLKRAAELRRANRSVISA